MRQRESYSPLAALLPLVLLVLPVALFWSAFTLRGIFFYGDIVGQFYPLKVALSRAVASGRLPLWSPELMAGYPLLAEGEGGFLYPLNLLFAVLLPPTAAVNYHVLAHLAIAGIGMYVFCRVLRIDPLSSAVGGAVYMLSGFLIAHLNHLSILSAAAWLPFLFACTELMVTRPRPGPYAALLGLVIAIQFYAGHAQVSFLSLFGVGLFVVYRSGTEFLDGRGLGRPLALLLAFALAVVVGAGLAGPQLLTTLELTDLSVRAGGLSGDFFTSFSLPPPYIATFLLPFLTGNPLATTTPATAVEWCGYAGVATLLLALYATLFRRDRYTAFFFVLLLVSLVLALGQWNPLYERLAAVPGFNLFRVPARYLLLYTFALATLSALGLQRLAQPGLPLASALPPVVPAALGVALFAIGVVVVWVSADVERLIALWQVLPWVLLALSLLVLVARGRQLLGGRSFATLAVLLLAVDLYAFVAVFGATFNATVPRTVLEQRPGVMDALQSETDLYRVYTHERIYPAAEGVREALAWNYALAPGVPSLSGYLPLTLQSYREYAAQLPTSARLASMANVRYLFIPQVIGDDEASERDNLANPLSPSPVGRKVEFAPLETIALEVESSLSHSVGLENGTVVADVIVADAAGTRIIPLRAGIETAEWAYERPDVQGQMRHSRPPLARQWPARSAYPPQSHPGNTYLAQLKLGRTMSIASVEIVPRHPAGYVNVDRVVLVDAAGKRTPLSSLAGAGDFETAYRGNEVVAYRNRDARPRFSIAHEARRALDEDQAWQLLGAANFDPGQQVVLGPDEPPGRVGRLLARNPFANRTYAALDAGPAVAEETVRVLDYGAESASLRVSLTSPGYLVAAETFYPGWRGYVDGREVPILRANWLFRAVEIPVGEHTVEMRYEPAALGAGWLLALLSALGLAIVAVVLPFTPGNASSSWREA